MKSQLTLLFAVAENRPRRLVHQFLEKLAIETPCIKISDPIKTCQTTVCQV